MLNINITVIQIVNLIQTDENNKQKKGDDSVKANTDFFAFSKNYPIFTIGRTISELMENAPETANL